MTEWREHIRSMKCPEKSTERESVQVKGMENIFSKIGVEKSPNLRKRWLSTYWTYFKHQSDNTRKESFLSYS